MIDSKFRLDYYGREFLTAKDGLPGERDFFPMHSIIPSSFLESYTLAECWNSPYPVALGFPVYCPKQKKVFSIFLSLSRSTVPFASSFRTRSAT